MLEKLIEQAKKINKMYYEVRELSTSKKLVYLAKEVSELCEIVEREDLNSYGLIFKDFDITIKLHAFSEQEQIKVENSLKQFIF